MRHFSNSWNWLCNTQSLVIRTIIMIHTNSWPFESLVESLVSLTDMILIISAPSFTSPSVMATRCKTYLRYILWGFRLSNTNCCTTSLYSVVNILNSTTSPEGYKLLHLISSYLQLDSYISLDIHTASTLAAIEAELLVFDNVLKVNIVLIQFLNRLLIIHSRTTSNVLWILPSKVLGSTRTFQRCISGSTQLGPSKWRVQYATSAQIQMRSFMAPLKRPTSTSQMEKMLPTRYVSNVIASDDVHSYGSNYADTACRPA